MMNQEDTAALVIMVTTMERREPTIPEVELWHSIIGHLDVALAREAVNLALREVTGLIKASHIIERVKRARVILERKRYDAAHPGQREALRRITQSGAIASTPRRKEIGQ